MARPVEKEAGESKLRREVNAAIDRIVAGKPRSAALKAKFKAGKLKLTFEAVQEESGYSRTNYGGPKSRYPDLWMRINGIRNPKPKGHL